MRRGLVRIWSLMIPLGLLAAALLASGEARSAQRHTIVSIRGTSFLINQKVTYAGTPARGLLLNSRMAQAIFDDANPATMTNWAYPDTHRWDPRRNVNEFVAAIPSYTRQGLRAVAMNLQGGSPNTSAAPFSGNGQMSVVSAFTGSGSLNVAWLARLDRVIRACDRNGLVVILGFFYFGQDERLVDDRSVTQGVDKITDWLLRKKFRNVLVEIGNESDLNYDHPILQPDRVSELIQRVQRRSRGRLKVSTSFAGGAIPPSEVLRRSDFILVHGNGQSSDQVGGMIDRIRMDPAYRAHPKPIVFNEDSTNIENMNEAIAKHASWGYYDQGKNNYVDGFQSPPVNWRINTASKKAFFSRLRTLSRKSR
jgi:hypothetical protein